MYMKFTKIILVNGFHTNEYTNSFLVLGSKSVLVKSPK